MTVPAANDQKVLTRPDLAGGGNEHFQENQSKPVSGPEVQSKPFRSGLVAILGRPNVGKSTLLNVLLGTKLAAVSPKPQTSRQRLLGVLHGEGFQIGLLDTPGWPANPRVDELGQRMMREVREALDAADLVLLMAVPPKPPGEVEKQLVQEIAERKLPALAVINKIDTVQKAALLPVMAAYNETGAFREIVPVSVLREDGLGLLLQRVIANLPEREPLFPPDQLTDRTERYLVSEIIREKVFALYGEEVPYSTAVRIETFRDESEEHGGKGYIDATIFVERPSQKAILVGKGGAALKEVGVAARPEIEELLGRPVFLQLWVKTQPHWRQDPRFLRSLEEQ
jgi:GTP-binding protein Era